MLASAEAIEIVADTFKRYNVTTSVVDPVRPTITTQHQKSVADIKNRSWYRRLALIFFPSQQSQR